MGDKESGNPFTKSHSAMWRIMRRVLRTGSMLIAGACMFGCIAGSAKGIGKPTIYNLDLRGVWNLSQTDSYDIQHTAACVQGLANRDAPRVFLTFSDADAKWLTRLRESGGLCEGWRVQNVGDIHELLNLFRKYISGVILYDPNPDSGVTSTSLVATTAGGVEGAIAVRKDTGPGSMYDYLVNTLGLPVLIDLTGKFIGAGTIWQTNTPSTGSRKCDAYMWAKEKYIDSGRCNPTVLSYTLDLWALRASLGNNCHTQLSNLDYAISQRGFCFELSPWGDERPNDDPTQPLGTDLATYKKILEACNVKAGRNKMIKSCGFTNWNLKYTSDASAGRHGSVETEWETVRLNTAYNVYMEADAPECNYIGNCSFYAGLLPEFRNRRYVQNPPPTYGDMISRGLIDRNGHVVPGNYVLMGMGDYDQASWTLYWLAGDRYDDPARGDVYCSWGVDPNAIDRVCVAMDYMYRHKSPKDFFMAWDSGAGYINPGQLYGDRSPSGYRSAVSVWQEHCRNYYRTLDYSISAWLLNGSQTLTTTDCSNQAPFSGDGIGVHQPANFGTPNLVNNVPVQAIDNGGIIDNPTGVNFAWYRSILSYPRDIKAQAHGYASSGHNHRFLDAYTFYYLMRYHLGGKNDYRATWISDTIPRIMAAGRTYHVTVTTRNDGWDTWDASEYRLAHAIVAPGAVPAYEDYDINSRHYLPVESVAPGDTVTFTFDITAPGTLGNYDLYYDMVRDGVTWFHEQNNIEWKMEIIVAANETDVDTDKDGVPDVTEEANGGLYWYPGDI